MSPMSESFEVDLMDPADIRRKLPRAQSIMRDLEEAAAEAEQRLDHWRRLVLQLEQFVAGPSASPSQNGHHRVGTKEDLVVALVNQLGRGVRPPEVFAMLREQGVDVASVNSANTMLHTAWKKQRIAKLRKGLYAPLAEAGPMFSMSGPGRSGVGADK